jgi:glutamyl aminopeptidase
LKPDLESGSFQGAINITVNVTSNRKDIILHSKNLTIDTVQLTHFNDSKVFHIENVHENANEEVLLITPQGGIPPGVYNLHLKYNGSMLDKIVGLYRSKRLDNDTGTTR